MQDNKKDRRTIVNSPEIDIDLFGTIPNAGWIHHVGNKPVLAGTKDEDIFYRVCEGHAHPRWRTPLLRQTPRVLGTFETRIEASEAMLRSKWLLGYDKALRCVYIQRSCDGGRTWRQSQTLTVVTQRRRR